MISFKDFITEKWVDGDNISMIGGINLYIDIFVNPSPSELKQCGNMCRGVLDKDGNLYVSTNSDFTSTDTKGTRVIHKHIIDFLQQKNKLPKGDYNQFYGALAGNKQISGVTVQRVGTKSEMALGESVKFDSNPSSKLNQKIFDIIDKAAEKK